MENSVAEAFLVTFLLIENTIFPDPVSVKTGLVTGEEVLCAIVSVPFSFTRELGTYSIPLPKVTSTVPVVPAGSAKLTVSLPTSKFLLAK